MAPRTILYLTPSVRLLGARQSLLALVKNLDPERYRPIVCCQRRGPLTDALDEIGVQTVFLPTGWWRKVKYWPRIPYVLFRMARLIAREDVALIHCNEIYPNPYAVVVGRWTRTPVVSHMRLSVTESMTRKYYLHRAERIIVVSDAAGHDFDHWPDKRDKVAMIYNGVDPDKYVIDKPRERVRRDLGYGADEFVMGQIATWAHRKRQHVAVEALSLIAERVPQARLLLVGGAARSQQGYEAELRALIASRKLSRQVQMLPFTDSMAEIYNAIDLNLLVSGDEGFGRTIIEAGSVGVPTIGAIAGGIPEIIRDGNTGWLVPVDDPQALAERMEQLAVDPAQALLAGERAMALVRDRFSIAKHAREVQALYDRILKEREPGGA